MPLKDEGGVYIFLTQNRNQLKANVKIIGHRVLEKMKNCS
jgi:hypothetical protein